ncbi:PLP-dependent aminotransferase family protein [Paenibacillus turpanensis]|uniref:MocR-like pyridoxine biosynthesis transcription factor PdxR n=1 Tax=Paenibacillus turpanensis TaxID=2689078 RepID=UPI001407AC72|nr:PLP-dependent aminotransferase family protein [Paenibacillus turpanensis]
MLYIPQFHHASALPYYIALYEAIKRDIMEGRLRPNDALPSIRKLAAGLSISTTPVEVAYQQLIAEGFVESRPRQGFFVVSLPVSYGELKLGGPQLEPAQLDETAAASEQVYIYDFHMAKNDNEHFPIRVWKKLFSQVLREDYEELLFYGDAQGEKELREQIATYLGRLRGVICRPEQIVIGAEQHLLMHYLALLLRDVSSVIAAEQPSYPLIPSTFESEGYEVYTIPPADHGGISVPHLEQSSARILFVSPSHRFPDGRVMPFSERLELLEWAKRREAYILEDDYGRELRYQGQSIPALQGVDSRANVIYLGGFSQILAPDLCIHYMVLPETLLPRYHSLRRTLLFESSCSRIVQRALRRFMEEGHFERHVSKMRNVYRQKNNVMVQSLRALFGEWGEIVNPEAGLHVILKLHSAVSEREMVRIARENGVFVAAASPYYPGLSDRNRERQFMIGFGGVPEERIHEGLLRLKELWAPSLFPIF